TMELDEDAGEFSIAMRHCPSKGMLLDIGHMEAYYDYCGHCAVLYARVLEPMGYECEFDMSGVDGATCSFVVRTQDAGRR
ncbi:MAG: hypothetical protein ACOCX2_12285, partial [Armatimonadota bacterium]